MAKERFKIPDCRCEVPSCYPPEQGYFRRGRMKSSWKLGVAQRTDGSRRVEFDDGITWGSIGQLLGYLFGDVEEAIQDKLYEQMEKAFRGTDRWVSGGNERE